MGRVTPEGRVKKRVKQILSRFPLYQHWPVPSGYGDSTLDCIGCHRGRFFAIETKAPGERLTPRQEMVANSIKLVGGRVFVIEGEEAAELLVLERWLKEAQ